MNGKGIYVMLGGRVPVGFVLLTVVAAFAGCASTDERLEAARTQLQIREFQTRSFDAADHATVMKAMLNVLQDEGYIIKNADAALGFISATREIDVAKKLNATVKRLWSGKDARWEKNTVEECSANVTRIGDQCRVRVNFQVKLLDNLGNVLEIDHVDDALRYQDFFSKVDKSIYLQKEGV